MAKKFGGFTEQQKEVLARRMGYDGPIDQFGKFLQSSPAHQQKFLSYETKAKQMVEGAAPQQPKPQASFAEGGAVTTTTPAPTTNWAGNRVTAEMINNPSSITPQVKVDEMATTTDQFIDPTSGQVQKSPAVTAATTAPTAQVAPVATTPAPKVQTASVAPAVASATQGMTAATGTVSDKAQMDAAQGKMSEGAMASAATVDPKFIDKVTTGQLQVSPEQLATPAGQNAQAIKAEVAQAGPLVDAVAQTGVVQANELPEPALIREQDMAQAQAITSSGLSTDATAVAARLEKFTVDNETLAKAMQGEVNSLDTVQGQLSELMKSFNDGTPAWAAGAIRAANAAMASRGIGSSSMAGAAIVQAAMESALPIAAQDAQVFQQMNLQNLNNRQQVALANAAAQQGLQLQNLNNEQQVALQNSANSFSLQSQNLSNVQSVVLANAQIKAALQGQNLSNQQQSNLATAARFAEVSNINLNNRQQTALQNNANSLSVNLANLGAKQQAYITNANLAASLQGQQISNEQQTAIQNAARFSEAANINFTAEQQTKLHNSALMQTIGLAELDAKQATTLQNAANLAQMDMANLNNRQQAAVQNAQAFLQMDMANLDNEQQMNLFKSQSIVQSLFTDQAAENASRQFNATSQGQTDQFFASLTTQAQQFNASQSNAMEQFRAGQTDSVNMFNRQMNDAAEQFNASNRLVIDQSNAEWRRAVTTANNATVNEANRINAQTESNMTLTAYNNLMQRERDFYSFAFTAGENTLNRANELALAKLGISAADREASASRSAGMWSAVGSLGAALISRW